MAVTISLYNHTPKLFANQEVTLASLKLMLLSDTATFTAANTTVNQVSDTGANEVSGSGWDSGGEPVGSAAVTITTTNDATLDAADVSVTATGGAIGPAFKALLLEGTKPLAFIDFDGSQEAGEGTDFKVVWNASGIITWTNAA